MGIAIPQVVTASRATGAQVIDGSLRIDSSTASHLERTPGSAGNRKIFTFSGWIKKHQATSSTDQSIIVARTDSPSADGDVFGCRFEDDGRISVYDQGNFYVRSGVGRVRDTNGWYHVFFSVNTTVASGNVKLYVNNVAVGEGTYTQNADTRFNSTNTHRIGRREEGSDLFQLNAAISNYYVIDGQALEPTDFGFTDPLTNTWKPKKFEHLYSAISTQYSGASTLTWDNSPIGNIYTLSNGNKTATAGGGGSGYSNADVWSIAIPADSTYAWTLDITNGDSTGGWYFTDSQTASGTHADERGGNSLGMRPGETHAGYYGTFASANGGSNGQDKISMPSASAGPGSARVDFVVYRPASGTGKVWVKNNGNSSWVGGGDPSDTSSTASFIIPDGTTYFGLTFYDRSSDQIATLDGDGSIQQKIGGNSFYLPFDGSAPIGQDQSGKGNNWTPENFGGSVALDNPIVSGARPILNTTQGGTQAGVGVFGSRENVGYAVTYYDDGGGNKYYIDGVKQATLTGLIRGATYTFNTVALGSTHPFRLSATSAHGTEYTNGVAAITGAATTITIPHDAPNELYYYCTAHSGMGSSITGITTNEKLADQYASNCVLAVPLNGHLGDVCASIACTANNKTPTSSSVLSKRTKQNFYSLSHHWSANSDTLQYAEQGDELVFGQGDFTIECWVYDDNGHNGTGGRCYIFDNRIGGSVVGDPPTMVGHCDGHAEFTFYDGDSEITYTPSTTVGKWWHYAVTREGTTTRMFIDGILRGSSTSSTNFTNNGIGVGRATDGGYGWAGYIQDFRVYKGIAKYTSDFVIPATSPDVLPDTPSGMTGGSKLTKIADGAVEFDGSGDYLFAGSSSDYSFGTGDFTIEGYFYFDSTTTSPNNGLWQISTTGGNRFESANSTLSCNLETSGGKTMQLFMGSAGGWRQNGSDYEFRPFMWNHVAEVRSSGVISVYINGKLSQSWSDTTSYNFGDCAIGGYYSTSYLWNGFISNFRVTKSAVYTGTFTPSFTPLTQLSDTKLLCCQSNGEPGAAVDAPSVSHVGGVNDGTQWSIGGAGDDNWDTSNPIENGFNEILSSDVSYGMARPKNASVTATWNAPEGGIPFTTLKLRAARDSGSYSNAIKINDVDVTSQFDANTATLATVTITGVSSPLTKLELTAQSGVAQPRFTAIYIDDVILTDPVNPRGNPRASNFNPFITDINTVRGQETGQVTLNPLSTAEATLTNGNLDYSSSGNMHTVISTTSVSSGKWYWENQRQPGGSHYYVGIADVDTDVDGNWTGSNSGYSWSVNTSGSICHNNAEGGALGSVASISGSDTVVGWALDMDEGTLEIYANGALVIPSSITSPNSKNPNSIVSTDDLAGRRISPAHGHSSHRNMRYNFGQKPFKFPPPDGFQPLNAANTRPVKVISRPDQYVGVTTYPGTGVTNSITGLNFGTKPDFVWIKKRAGGTARSNQLFDSIRGVHETLHSDSDGAEDTNSNRLTAFNRDGFTVGGDDGSNGSSGTFVSWCWRAGGSKNTFNVDDVGYASAAAAGLTAGDITPTGASVGTKQGFSIIRWTAPTWNGSPQQVPHGLTQSPSFIIAKVINDTGSWYCYHKDLDANPQNKYLTLNSNSAVGTLANGWGTSAPNSTTFGDRQLGWSDGKNVISYIWHDVPGLQKFGTYEANGSDTNGPYVELGFTPAILMLKNFDDTEHWYVYDPKRSPHNVAYQSLLWSNNGAENTGTSDTRVDLLSSGFKLRQANGPNTSGDGYIYAAWAAAPSVDLFGGGANAR